MLHGCVYIYTRMHAYHADARVMCLKSNHTCIHTYKYTHTYHADARVGVLEVQSHMYTYMHICIHGCVRMDVYTYTHMDVYTYIYIYIYIYIHTMQMLEWECLKSNHTCIHTNTYIHALQMLEWRCSKSQWVTCIRIYIHICIRTYIHSLQMLQWECLKSNHTRIHTNTYIHTCLADARVGVLEV